MKILAISGSPKRNGFTDALLEKAVDGARSAGASAEKIVLNDIIFKSCQECGGCDKTGVCVLDDDMKNIYRKLESADGVIVASPVFFGSVSAQLKAMIDRLQSVWMAKYILKKESSHKGRRRGIFLCAGGKETTEYFESAKKIIRIFFTTCDIEYSGEFFAGGLNTGKNIEEKEAYLKKSFELGKAFAHDLKNGK